MKTIYKSAFNHLCKKFDIDTSLTRAKKFDVLEAACYVMPLSIEDYQMMFGQCTTFDGVNIKAVLFGLHITIHKDSLITLLRNALKPKAYYKTDQRIKEMYQQINDIALQVKTGKTTLAKIKRVAKKAHNKELKKFQKYTYSSWDFNASTYAIIRDFEKIINHKINQS